MINENENENNMKKEIRLVLTMTMLIALCVGVVACCAMAIGSAVREDDSNTVGYSFMAVVFAVFATKLGQVAKDIMEEKS